MRNRIKNEDSNKCYDLIVIGGGINGCGIARDAAERGLSVLLLEKEDFGSGTTSASTRLIHGGLRYLEYFEFDLVQESLTERELLLKNAPHLLKPLELCIPIFKGDKRNYWLIKLGMILYDLLSFRKSLPPHKMLSRTQFEQYEPSVINDDLAGAAIYYDLQVPFPERLCLENILMAKNASVFNHVEVVGFKVHSSKISSVEVVDKLSHLRYEFTGKIIVNASGPWVDSLCGLVDKNVKQQLSPTKGSHIIVKNLDYLPQQAVYSSAKSDGRPFFVIPWLGFYLIGTTDIAYTSSLDKVKASSDEINYLINETNLILSKGQISKDDILFTYSGVRSLPASKNNNPSSITRKHLIREYENEKVDNFLSVIGGKITTYRHLSEEVVDRIYKKLNYKFTPTKTKFIPLLKTLGIDELSNLDTENLNSIILHCLENEHAFTISDLFLRRLPLSFTSDIGESLLSRASKIIQEYFNLSNEEINNQINDYMENVVKVRKVS